jgi:dihydroorotate dehydrogenase
MCLYKCIYASLLTHVDAEFCHDAALRCVGVVGRHSAGRRMLRTLFATEDERLAVNAFGLCFSNPLGLASGFDKDAEAISGLACMGFGHIEAGTATPLAQPGNSKPRIFRLAKDRAVINRMGFPNTGAEAIRANLQKQERSQGTVIGMSIGKGRVTSLERAHEDYCHCLDVLYDCADYFAINVSSPNTPELRRLQTRELLETLVRALVQKRNELAQKQGGTPKPLLVKVAPDLEAQQLDDVLDVALGSGLSGIIATNTTLSRPSLHSRRSSEEGGLSGLPLRATSTQMVRDIRKRTGGKLPIIGCGGVFTAEDAWEKLLAGATLVQAYTGFIYEGPAFAKKVNWGLLRLMDRQGIRSISEVVGRGAR